MAGVTREHPTRGQQLRGCFDTAEASALLRFAGGSLLLGVVAYLRGKTRTTSAKVTGTEVEDLYRASLDALAREYGELSERFQRLDSKAQSTASTSGIFLAAIFAFVRQIPPSTPMTEVSLTISILFLLLITVILSLLAMFIYRIVGPPTGEFVFTLAQDLDGRGMLKSAEMIGFLCDQARRWMLAIRSIRGVNQRKSRLVTAAQCTLLCAVALVAITAAISIVE